MLVHSENIKRVVGVTTERDPDAGFFVLCLEVVTAGNVHKVVRLPHLQADILRNGLVGEFETMDEDQRKASWNASLTAHRAAARLA
ncbi:hypothetical protein ACWGA9_06315 [Streptomyces sp. NPDC054950]